ncbi:helix-turn-helix domain-containing protein [Paenibacillus sp. PL2-23]|uniref:helix-turn-helix domain-containing protein n=1 Tax=Paenibacillus sp. PL2-23 TaxID=2100729 RepID=UPI0030F6D82F
MNYLQAIQRFADEVEERIEETLDIDRLIASTYVSKFHFYRLFKAVVGISVYDYIRKRKLIRAAADIRASHDRILDIAIKYGFGSQEVFSRNFKQMYRISPAKYRESAAGQERVTEAIASKIDIESIWLDIKARHGHVVVVDAIETIEEMQLVGIERQSNDNNIDTIFPFIQAFIDQAEQIPNRKSDSLFRLCYDIAFLDEVAYFKEMVAVEVEKVGALPLGMQLVTLEQRKVMRFVHKGKLFHEHKDGILSSYHFIYEYRIPAAGEVLTSELLLEKYEPTFTSPYSDDAQVEIYLSVDLCQ